MKLQRKTVNGQNGVSETLGLFTSCEDIEPLSSIQSERRTGKRDSPKFYSTKPRRESSTILNTTNQTSCAYCNDTEHRSVDYTKLKSPQERKVYLQHSHRCFDCTGTRHVSKDSRSTRKCTHCNKRHLTSIYLSKQNHRKRSPVFTSPMFQSPIKRFKQKLEEFCIVHYLTVAVVSRMYAENMLESWTSNHVEMS